MPARFCPACGTETPAGAKFCIECGAGLAGQTRRTRPARPFRPTLLGGAVLGGLALAGVAIWVLILTPSAPRPRPSQGMRPSAASAPAPPPVEMPAEITQLVDDLAARADAAPDDLGIWVHLGEVYYRTAQFDPSYRPKALAAFDHVLERDPHRAEALRGKGNVYYDQEDAPNAIAYYESFLALKPGDSGVRTDLATMYLANGERDRAFSLYRAVIADDPEFMQAHYNLAAALHAEGDDAGALAELRIARSLARDEPIQQRIDALIGRLSGEKPPSDAPPPPADRTPFQAAVEASFRAHEIMGPRIASIDWTGPGTVRVRMQGFPMDGMPPMVREQFETRLRTTLETAQAEHPVDGALSVTLLDAATGVTMTTVGP